MKFRNQARLCLAIYDFEAHIMLKARLFCATTLARPVLLWPFLALPILLLVHFGADLFGVNFTKIIFFLFLIFQFFYFNL